MTDVLRYPSTSSELAGRQRHRRATVECRSVGDADELAAHHRVRQAVFVSEQGIFDGSDIDEHDRDPRTVHLVGLVDGTVHGAVRLWPHGDGRWHGDRLAVDAGSRHVGLGAPLVRLAVATAAAAGGTEMTAHVQLPNVRFFQALGWTPRGQAEDYLGVPHQPMTIGLQ